MPAKSAAVTVWVKLPYAIVDAWDEAVENRRQVMGLMRRLSENDYVDGQTLCFIGKTHELPNIADLIALRCVVTIRPF